MVALIDAGADLSAVDGKDGLNVLHWAAMEGRGDWLRALIEKGGDPFIVDGGGRDALALAKLLPSPECIEIKAAKLRSSEKASLEKAVRKAKTSSKRREVVFECSTGMAFIP